jgi:hypothetical protein
MASCKQQRKSANAARKAKRPPTGAFRHRDGDRRRRGEGLRVEDAIALKQAMQGGLPPPQPNA